MGKPSTPYDLLESVEEGLFRYWNVSEKFEVSINEINAGSHVPEHVHDVDVFNYVMKGEFIVRRGGLDLSYKSGDWIFIPANERHAVMAKEPVTLLELWKK